MFRIVLLVLHIINFIAGVIGLFLLYKLTPDHALTKQVIDKVALPDDVIGALGVVSTEGILQKIIRGSSLLIVSWMALSLLTIKFLVKQHK